MTSVSKPELGNELGRRASQKGRRFLVSAPSAVKHQTLGDGTLHSVAQRGEGRKVHLFLDGR